MASTTTNTTTTTAAALSLGVFICLLSACGEKTKVCTSRLRYVPGARLEVRVPTTKAVQVITVPPDGIVAVEVPSKQDCNEIAITPLIETAPQ